MIINKLVFILFMIMHCFLGGAFPKNIEIKPADFRVSSGSKIELFQNHPLQQTNTAIDRIIIVIHGVARNADEYFDYIVKAAEMEQATDKTLILAPHFKIDSDPREADELFWTDSWKFGDKSADSNNQVGISSYQVIDEILESLWASGRFPSVKQITIAGHSAGGQFVTRYAAGSPFPDRHPMVLSYVVANPSSYLYFSPKRWDDREGFVLPDNSCPDYNSYPYGLNRLNSYMGHVGPFELKSRFTHRNVTLLLGEADTLPEYLDTSCEANLQGKNRIERGLTYFKFIQTFYPKSKLKVKTVPGIGHSGEEMFRSKEGRELLFH